MKVSPMWAAWLSVLCYLWEEILGSHRLKNMVKKSCAKSFLLYSHGWMYYIVHPWLVKSVGEMNYFTYVWLLLFFQGAAKNRKGPFLIPSHSILWGGIKNEWLSSLSRRRRRRRKVGFPCAMVMDRIPECSLTFPSPSLFSSILALPHYLPWSSALQHFTVVVRNMSKSLSQIFNIWFITFTFSSSLLQTPNILSSVVQHIEASPGSEKPWSHRSHR